MLDENVSSVLDAISPSDVVLDVGAWFCPFRRADYVIDVMPYATRGAGGFQGPGHERFTEKTWIQRDVCDREPWPFPTRMFDFVLCSHGLEDFRDPVGVCTEMMRVARRGYIEVPSVEAELSRGVEARHWVGYAHHHWIVAMEPGRVRFHMKPHSLQGRWKFHLPARHGRALPPQRRVQWMFWDDTFEVDEVLSFQNGFLSTAESYVRATGARPHWRYGVEAIRTAAKRMLRRG